MGFEKSRKGLDGKWYINADMAMEILKVDKAKWYGQCIKNLQSYKFEGENMLWYKQEDIIVLKERRSSINSIRTEQASSVDGLETLYPSGEE